MYDKAIKIDPRFAYYSKGSNFNFIIIIGNCLNINVIYLEKLLYLNNVSNINKNNIHFM